MAHTWLILPLYAVFLIAFCRLANRRSPPAAEQEQRLAALDGLRGLLATAVLVHHFYISYGWHTTGVWQHPESPLLDNMGAVPVSLFFMITGYLFGYKILRQTPQWSQMLASRLRRIYPMYLFSLLLIAAIALYQSRDTLAPLGTTLSAIGSWILFVAAPINGFQDSTHINAGVNWTLVYEACFYLALPTLYCLLRRRLPWQAMLISLVALALLWPLYQTNFSNRFLKLFAIGIAVAIFEGRLKRLAVDYSSIGCSLLAGGVLVVCMLLKGESKAQMLLLGIPFTLFVLGNSFRGLLTQRGMRLLGDASFSIYLLHGIVIYLLFSVLSIHDFSSGTFSSYALYLPLVLALVCSLSLATYRWIEKPLMQRRPSRTRAVPTAC